MHLFHATPAKNLARIREQGLRVDMASPTAKIKGVWLATSGNRPWAVLHTIKKHQVALEDVVIIEVSIQPKRLTRFRKGLWYSLTDIAPESLGIVIPGSVFGVGVSD